MSKFAFAFSKNKENIVDFRGSDIHPLTACYGEVFEGFLFDANVSKGRCSPGYKLEEYFLTKAVVAMKKNIGNEEKAARNVINIFYQTFQPKNANNWFGLNLRNEALGRSPPWYSVLPWRARSKESYADVIKQAAEKENGEYGLNCGVNGGWTFCGPAIKEKIDIEVKRLYQTHTSIANNGYIRTNAKGGDIVCSALVNENNDWRWLVTSGFHRAAILAGIGCEKITIRVNLIVKLGESAYWPHVVDGLYTEEEGRSIFYKLFDGSR